MQIFALFMLLGFFLSWLIPETKGKTLEELSGENDEDKLYRQSEANQAVCQDCEVIEESALRGQANDSPVLLHEAS
jgi:hypothetical protein